MENPKEVAQILHVAKTAAKAGGEIASGYFQQGVAIRSKNDTKSYDLVTDADVESERAIADVIRKSFPDHQILGEESLTGDTQADDLWIVDPIDGTTNFAHGIPHFAISIAYYQKGIGQCGVVYNPAREDWFWATNGGGAFHNGSPIQTATEDSLDQVLVGVGFYYDRGAMMEATLAAVHELFEQHIHCIRRFGTAALDLCQVAMGNFGAFFEFQLSSWDFAAGAIIVNEAGGVITTCDGSMLPLDKTSVLAANTQLHNIMTELLKKHLPD